jgi:hypothetical protein
MMRRIFTLVSLLLIFLLCILSGCKHSSEEPVPEPTAKEKATGLLTGKGGKWNPAPLSNWVMVEGVNVAELFQNFTISFTSTGFTTSGTSPVWPRSGTWHFKDETAKVFIRDSDNKEITIESLDENSLRLTLMWEQGTTSGRSLSVAGKHEFILSK